MGHEWPILILKITVFITLFWIEEFLLFQNKKKYKGPFVRNTSKSNFQTFEKLEKKLEKLNDRKKTENVSNFS